jgi:DNA-binding SARP family transcriptional activator
MSGHRDFEPVCDEPLRPGRLNLFLLGSPRVMVNDTRVMGLSGEKTLALLAYLAVEAQRPHRRRKLAALFWPDQPRSQALQNLRQTLARLRTALADRDADAPHLLVDLDAIQFNRRSDYWLDTERFETLLAAAERHAHRRLDSCPSCLTRLAEAVEYYRGEFAADLNPKGSLDLDEWLLIQREGLQRRACVALQALAGSHLVHCEHELAQHYAGRLLRFDPWNEAVQRLLLRSLALAQGRNAALRQYGGFRAALAGELGVEPEDATMALMDQIRAGRLSAMQYSG